MANMISVEAVRQEQSASQSPQCRRQKKIAIYLVREGTDPFDYRLRALALAANVEINRLYQMTGSYSLSTRSKLEARAERERANACVPLVNDIAFCEVGRAEAASNRAWNIAGSDRADHREGPQGACGARRRRQSCIECAGWMIDLFLIDDDGWRNQYGHHLWKYITELRKEVARRFGCDVWLIHSLRTGTNFRKAPGTAFDAWGNEFRAVQLASDFVFTIGRQLSDGAAVMASAKHRRYGDHGMKVIQVQTEFCRVVAGIYEIDPISGRLVDARPLTTPGPSTGTSSRCHGPGRGPCPT